MPQTTTAASCYLFCENNNTKKILLSILRGIPGPKTTFIVMLCDDDVERELCQVPNLLVATEFIRNQKKENSQITLFTSVNNSKPKAWSTTVLSKSEILSRAQKVVTQE